MSLARHLEQIYRRHRQELLNCAFNVLRCPKEAEDAVHDAFVRLFALRLRPWKLKAYVFRAVRNAALDRWRARRRTDALSALPIPEPITNPEPSDLDALLNNLQPDQREVILLHLQSGLTFREVALALGKPQGTVASLYRRGLETIRNLIEPNHEPGRPYSPTAAPGT